MYRVAFTDIGESNYCGTLTFSVDTMDEAVILAKERCKSYLQGDSFSVERYCYGVYFLVSGGEFIGKFAVKRILRRDEQSVICDN